MSLYLATPDASAFGSPSGPRPSLPSHTLGVRAFSLQPPQKASSGSRTHTSAMERQQATATSWTQDLSSIIVKDHQCKTHFRAPSRNRTDVASLRRRSLPARRSVLMFSVLSPFRTCVTEKKARCRVTPSLLRESICILMRMCHVTNRLTKALHKRNATIPDQTRLPMAFAW